MTPHKPPGHNAVSPYLLVADVAAVLDFLVATFGAEILFKSQDPAGPIRHAEVRIDDSVVMMGRHPDAAQPGSTHVYVPDVDACYGRALAAGGSAITPPADQAYGDRSAGVKDPQGNTWWLATPLPPAH